MRAAAWLRKKESMHLLRHCRCNLRALELLIARLAMAACARQTYDSCGFWLSTPIVARAP
eukprot:2677354-Alexandrium_andersonii.AAC.1